MLEHNYAFGSRKRRFKNEKISGLQMSDALIWVSVFLLVACLIFLLIAHTMVKRYWGDPTALNHALLWLYLTLFFIFITLVVLIGALLARCGSLACGTKPTAVQTNVYAGPQPQVYPAQQVYTGPQMVAPRVQI
jgi:hypothetical protein